GRDGRRRRRRGRPRSGGAQARRTEGPGRSACTILTGRMLRPVVSTSPTPSRAPVASYTRACVPAATGAATSAAWPWTKRRAPPALDLHALAGQLVQPPALVVDRRVHRRHLRDAADEAAARRLQPLAREPGHRRLGEHAAGEIVRVGGDAEADGRDVLLVLVHQIGRELGGLADEQRQDAGGGRVEGAGVADAPHAEPLARERDGVERR